MKNSHPDAPADYTAALFALGHRFRDAGVLAVEGPDREAFLQGQLTQDTRSLAPGQSRPMAGLTPKGKLLYFGRAGRLRGTAAAHRRRVGPDGRRRAPAQVRRLPEGVGDATARTSSSWSASTGRARAPLPRPTAPSRCPPTANSPRACSCRPASRAAVEAALARGRIDSRLGRTTAEILRVEAGRPRFGVESDPNSLPDELGLQAAISTTKGCYVGQEIVARLRTYGRVNRRLVGFRFPEEAVPPGTVFSDPAKESLELGRVTSAVVSPRFGPVGLGLAFRDVAEGAALRLGGRARAMRRRGAAALRVNPRAAARPWQIHLALAGAQVGFALFPIFGKLALAVDPALSLRGVPRGGGRHPARRHPQGRRRRRRIRAADRPRLFLYALLGVSFNQVLFIFGLFLTTAINTTILTTTIPVFTLAAAVLLGRERLRFSRGARHPPRRRGRARPAQRAALRLEQRFLPRATCSCSMNCTSYSLYLVLSRPILAHYRALTFTAAVFRYGAVFIVLIALPDLLRFQPSRVPPIAWACLAAVILLLHGHPLPAQLLGARAHARLARRVLRLSAAAHRDRARDPHPGRGPLGQDGRRGAPDLRRARGHRALRPAAADRGRNALRLSR